MFQGLTLRGAAGSIVWGYQDAAVLKAWTIARTKKAWTLNAIVDTSNAFRLRQRPLLFTAPRDRGRWCFQLQAMDVVGPNQIRATLGPPEF